MQQALAESRRDKVRSGPLKIQPKSKWKGPADEVMSKILEIKHE